MKMIENDELYEELCSYENLELAFKKARRGKTLKPYVIEFENKLDENLQLNDELAKKGTIKYIIGDKLDDLKPAEKLKAKSIFVSWGHPTGGEKDFADYSIDLPKELEKIIQ